MHSPAEVVEVALMAVLHVHLLLPSPHMTLKARARLGYDIVHELAAGNVMLRVDDQRLQARNRSSDTVLLEVSSAISSDCLSVLWLR